MPAILDEIAEYKRAFVRDTARMRPLEDLKRSVQDAPPIRDFRHALSSSKEISIIAEIKRASPSKGTIREDFDPVEIARIYERNGARALSVLTDEKYFQGRAADLREARRVCALPTLRKDLIVDEYQIYESRAIGADAILLIVALLDDISLRDYLKLATGLGLSTLVECHSEEELYRALDAGAGIIGINNRNLRTFETSMETTFRLLPKISPGKIMVSESGVDGREEVIRLHNAGIHAVLVGEALMREKDMGRKLRALLGKT